MKCDNLLEARMVAAKINNLSATKELGVLGEVDVKSQVELFARLVGFFV